MQPYEIVEFVLDVIAEPIGDKPTYEVCFLEKRGVVGIDRFN